VIPLGLTSAQLADMTATLAASHSIVVTVHLTNLAGVKLADVSWRLLDGQVNVDATAEITRSCTLSLLDPERSMAFDANSPTDGAIYLDRMIQVQYSVRSPTTNQQFTIPVFCGPLTKMSRSDDIVNLEAQGKESLALGSVWEPRTYTKGWKKVDVIMSILQTRAGETKFAFPDWNVRLPVNYSIGRLNTPWSAAKHIADGMGMHLFYDGRGVARLQGYGQTSLFHFKTGDGGTVMSNPDVAYSTESLKNTVWVRGGVPKGAKKPIESVRYAPPSHPLSPARLGRNFIPRFLLETIENTSIVSQTEADRVAQMNLDAFLLQEIDVKFDALPVPHLEESDVVRIYTDEFSNAFRLSKYSIPLTSGPLMTVGYLGRVSKIRSRTKPTPRRV
jgi:hypothetical protein